MTLGEENNNKNNNVGNSVGEDDNTNDNNKSIRPGISIDSSQTMYYDVDQSGSKEDGQQTSPSPASASATRNDPPGGRLGSAGKLQSVYFDAKSGDDYYNDDDGKIRTGGGGLIEGGGRAGEDDEDSIDFLQDKFGHMTYGRRLALYLGSKYTWYNPKLKEEKGNENDSNDGNDNRPSIEKAWAYFEHVTLERYEIPDNYSSKSTRRREGEEVQDGIIARLFKGGNQQLNRAEPGETSHATKLYSPLTTPLTQMVSQKSHLYLFFFIVLTVNFGVPFPLTTPKTNCISSSCLFSFCLHIL